MKLEKLRESNGIVLAGQRSKNPLDEEILLVLLLDNEDTPFVIWKRRIDGPKGATYLGHYYEHFQDAYDDWKIR